MMGRYLDSGKIGLLALTCVYTESLVSAEATIPILSFLAQHTLPESGHSPSGRPSHRQPQAVHLLDNIEKISKICASGIPGRTIWDLFLNNIWKLEHLDALHVFFEHLPSLIRGNREGSPEDDARQHQRRNIRVGRNSPIGIFIRRAHLEFIRLQLDDTAVLWQSFVEYRQPTFAHWSKRNPAVRGLQLDDTIPGLMTSSQAGGTGMHVQGSFGRDVEGISMTLDDVEKLLDFQVRRLQTMGTRLPKGAVSRLRKTIQGGASTPSLAFYVQFLEAWKMSDYPSSFEKLHQYFDYTMHNKDRAFYQYALLNLAALHADFGAIEEAMSAIHETISTAREHNDVCCLNYGLSWVYHFGKAFPAQVRQLQPNVTMGTEREALNFLKVKSKEVSMWCIFSSSLLAEARLALANGEAPSRTFEILLKSSFVNTNHELAATPGNHAALLSTTYARLGVTRQSLLSEEVYLFCHGSRSPVEDRLHVIVRLVTLLDQIGRHSDAWQCLADVETELLRTLKHEKHYRAQIGILRLKKLLHSDILHSAALILPRLKSIQRASPDLIYATTFLEIELHMRRQEYAEAMHILEKLVICLDQSTTDVYLNIRCLITKAQILDKAGMPQKGLSVAMRAATMSYTSKILPLLWEAVRALCAILNSVQEFGASVALLQSVMPRILECEDCHATARSYAILADAHVGQAGKIQNNALQMKESLHNALENLENAFNEYSRCRDVQGQCEMLAKKATVMHINGDLMLANDCASRHLAIQKAASEN